LLNTINNGILTLTLNWLAIFNMLLSYCLSFSVMPWGPADRRFPRRALPQGGWILSHTSEHPRKRLRVPPKMAVVVRRF